MWLLLLGINIALGILAIPLAMLGAGGLAAPALVVFGVTRSQPAAFLSALPGVIGIILLSALLGGVYLTFRSAVWTLTFRELRPEETPAETA